MATLLVIDMQPEFRAASFPHVIAGCLKQIKLAMRRKAAIIICEYGVKCLTDRRIKDAIRSYDKVTFVCKDSDDGSRVILQECRWHGYDTTKFRACGVNFTACVARTVMGLAVTLPDSRIEVPISACGNWNGRLPTKQFPKRSNIFLTA